MTVRERIKRYRTEGGGVGLVRVEVLVPPEERQTIRQQAADMRKRHRDRVAATTARSALAAFRGDVEQIFPGRVREAVLFGSRARGDAEPGSDWDVALFIDDFDRAAESRPLNLLAARYHLRGLMVSPIGLPANRQDISPELLANIDRDGVRL